MPPRTRTRATKILKENIEVVKKLKPNSNNKIQNKSRKALADKTNSLSDDNASVDVPIKPAKTATKRTLQTKIADDNVRPRRERRLPTRYVENDVLINLSKSKDAAITSLEIPNKSAAKSVSTEVVSTKNTVKVVELPKQRPIRHCRLQSVKEKPNNVEPNTPDKSNKTISPFKTPTTNLETSLVVNRPKRICKLPSKYGDQSVSPNKVIPVQPCHASTPKVQKTDYKSKQTTKPVTRTKLQESKEKGSRKQTSKITPTKTTLKQTTLCFKKNSDTNNNAKSKSNQKSLTPAKSPTKSTKILTKKISPAANKKSPTKRIINKNFSFRILEDKPESNNTNQDIYEFTYDPNEEPAPQKKKRKRTVKRKPPKPKTYILKNNYDQNVSKTLEALKTKVKPGTSQTTQPTASTKPTVEKVDAVSYKVDAIVEKDAIQRVTTTSKPQNTPLTVPEIPEISYAPPLTPVNESAKTSIHELNYASIRVEDIVADFEVTSSNHNDLNYSPVSTPCRPDVLENQPAISNISHQVEDIAADFEGTSDHNELNYSPINTPCRPNNPENPSAVSSHSHAIRQSIANRDPLNLQGDLSFFEQPVASSSMNVSVRHPTASPWRVEFGSLPIRWHANTYVKANMTPAVECSFIAPEDCNKKKHVYTNLVLEENESLPQLETNTPNLVQTSIISFIKEVAERSAKKRERGKSSTPTKANSLFEDISSATNFGYKTPKKARRDKVVSTPNVSNESNKSTEETSKESDKSEKQKQKEKKKDKDCTYFGFDDSENQENAAPIKAPNERVRALRPRARAVLQEINSQGPTRSILPVGKKLASSDVVDRMYEQLKSAEIAPQFPEKDTAKEICTTNVDDVMDTDEQSVHLFEDIELVHHLKVILRELLHLLAMLCFHRNIRFKINCKSSEVQPPYLYWLLTNK